MMTSENKVGVQFRLSSRNFLDAYRLYRAVATKEKATHIIAGAILLFLGGLYFAFRFVQPPINAPGAIDLSPTIASLTLAFGVIYIFDLIPIALSWILFRQHIQEYPEPYQLTFEDSWIRFKNQNANATYEWNYYQEAFEGKTVFILMYGKRLYSTIPKSAFQTENEIDVFRNMLKGHLKNFRQELRS